MRILAKRDEDDVAYYPVVDPALGGEIESVSSTSSFVPLSLHAMRNLSRPQIVPVSSSE